MLKIWRKLFGLCEHKWAIIETRELIAKDKVTGKVIYSQCLNCGDVKRRALS